MTQRSIADDVVFVSLCGEHEGWVVSSDGLPRIPPGLESHWIGREVAQVICSQTIVVPI